MSDIKIEIVRKYRYLLKKCRNIVSSDDINLVRRAFDLALQNKEIDNEEDNQREMIKSLDIGLIIVEEIGLGRSSIICSLIYTVVVESSIPIKKIESLFGGTVASIIDGLIRVSNVYANHKIVYSDNFRKLLLSFAEDIRVQLIFLSQKLYEIRNADSLSDPERSDLAKEIEFLYVPFAHRLGLYTLKSEMEDRVLKILQPEIYNDIERKLAESSDEREKYIKKFVDPLSQTLKEEGLNFKIKARTKSVASILNKMKKKQVEFEEVYDIFAIRIILDSEGKKEKMDCWRVYSVVSDMYVSNPNRLRDWISVPKANGYESLQTTVVGPEKKWVEIQIRTIRMDEVAEKGFAAHWKYKGGQSEKTTEKWLSDLREVLEGSESEGFDLMDNFKVDLFNKEVYVFTPNGELRQLPVGATIIDFAYSIHTHLGDKCVGGKVNQKNVPLRYVLKNGDTVSVITSNNQQPNSDWLNHVVTTKAKNKIRQILKEEQYKVAEVGKEALARRLNNWKLDNNDEMIRKLMSHYKFKLAVDLYAAISNEEIEFARIKEILTQEEEVKEFEDVESNTLHSSKVDLDVLVIDDKLSNVDYKYASCCNPVFGDDVIGFVSIGDGIKIHRRNCKNALDLASRYPYRIVNAKWTNEGNSFYQAVLLILGNDEIGLVSNISTLISKDFRVQMRSISVSTDSGFFEGKISLLINNTNHLNNLIINIKNIKGVTKVSRYDTVEE
jgi:GTP pyrophosphokinase